MSCNYIVQCCDNNWACCKAYPWKGLGRHNTDTEEEDGSASGNYSGSGEIEFSPECKKYNKIRVSNFISLCIWN